MARSHQIREELKEGNFQINRLYAFRTRRRLMRLKELRMISIMQNIKRLQERIRKLEMHPLQKIMFQIRNEIFRLRKKLRPLQKEAIRLRQEIGY